MRRFIPLLLILVTVAPLALADPTAEELDNKRRLDQWRTHPEQLARLRRDTQVFLSLPAARRQQIVQLDHDLHEEYSAVQARLTNVADRYAAWLDQLKSDPQRAGDYRRIVTAPDKAARLAVVRELREQEWLRDQPKALREQVDKLEGQNRAERIKIAKEEDRQRQREWLIASRFWEPLVNKREMPSRLTDFPNDMQLYVNEYLMPYLSPDENKRLTKAEGQWPLYPMTLVELADKHPPALLGPYGPRKFLELPREVQAKLQAKKFKKVPEGTWPDFGKAVARIAAKNPGREFDFPNELWPHRQKGLSPPMQNFVLDVLSPLVQGDDRKLLMSPPQTWPAYPQMIQDLSNKYHLHPPWQTLPLPASRWDPYRLPRSKSVQGLPELPQQQLRDFLQFGLSDKERETLKLRPDDPASWQQLHQVYFDRNPQELRHLRQRDQRKHRPTPMPDLWKDKLEKLD